MESTRLQKIGNGLKWLDQNRNYIHMRIYALLVAFLALIAFVSAVMLLAEGQFARAASALAYASLLGITSAALFFYRQILKEVLFWAGYKVPKCKECRIRMQVSHESFSITYWHCPGCHKFQTTLNGAEDADYQKSLR
jgi:hypothetical protein